MASLFLMLIYSYIKGKKLISEVNITFNKHREIYLQGEKFCLNAEVPKQMIFETREVFVEVEYTSVINERTAKRQEVLLLQRRQEGKVSVELELEECDLITVEIKKFSIQDLCGLFRFSKDVEFYQSILVFPPEYAIENGELSIGPEEQKENPVFYLDLGSLRMETDPLVRKNYLTVVYTISSVLLMHQYDQKFMLGTDMLSVHDWEDYYELFLGIFEIIRGSMPFIELEDKSEITHVITTETGVLIPGYEKKIIALVGEEDKARAADEKVSYVSAGNLKEDLFYLTL